MLAEFNSQNPHYVWIAERWLSSSEYLLFLQRTRVCSPTVILGGSHVPVTPTPRGPIPSLDFTGTCTHVHIPTQRHTSTHNLKRNLFTKPSVVRWNCNPSDRWRSRGRNPQGFLVSSLAYLVSPRLWWETLSLRKRGRPVLTPDIALWLPHTHAHTMQLHA